VSQDGARHEVVDHTAELALRVSAGTPGELFAEACRALGAMLCEETGCGAVRTERTVRITAVDAEALLVDLLNELIYLGETERWAPVDVRVRTWTATGTELELSGVALNRTPARIKSATHHGLSLQRDGTRWAGEVIFDV